MPIGKVLVQRPDRDASALGYGLGGQRILPSGFQNLSRRLKDQVHRPGRARLRWRFPQFYIGFFTDHVGGSSKPKCEWIAQALLTISGVTKFVPSGVTRSAFLL